MLRLNKNIASFVITIAFIVTAGSTFSYSKERELKVVSSSADYPQYHNVGQLDSRADLIIEGIFSGDRRVQHWYGADDQLIFSASLSTVSVAKRIKGSSEDNIQIIEPAYLDKDTLYTVEGYNLMSTKSKYLLFLKQNPDGTYMLLGMYQGKYNLDDITAESEDEKYFTNHSDQKEHYKKLKEQISRGYSGGIGKD